MVRWIKAALLIGTLLPLSASAQTYTNQAAIVGAGAGVVGFNVVGPCNGQLLGWLGGVAQCVNASGSTGVTSVGLALPASTFTISGSPVTTTGTLTGSFATQTANTFFAGPSSGGAVTPGWRLIVGADLPNPAVAAKGGVQSLSPTTSQWVNALNTSGVLQTSQPAFSDISGAIVSAQCVTPGPGVLGCVQSLSPVTSNWINSITPAGVPVASQPSFNDISGSLGVAQIAAIPNNTVIANISGGSASPTSPTLTALIDSALGNVQGDIIYRNASTWTVLAPDTNGKVLTTGGLGANPSWTVVAGTGTVTSVRALSGLTATAANPITTAGLIGLSPVASGNVLANISGGSQEPSAQTPSAVFDSVFANAQGDILYRGGSTWTALAPGTAGQFLQTQGAGANPKWGAPAVLGSTNPSNPTGTTSGTGVMMGLGSTCKLTPTLTGRILFSIAFNMSNSGGVSTTPSFSMRYGTGSAPSNGAAPTGTSVASGSDSLSASFVGYEAMSGIGTSLSAGTQYWFDVAVNAPVGTTTLTGVTCYAMEF